MILTGVEFAGTKNNFNLFRSHENDGAVKYVLTMLDCLHVMMFRFMSFESIQAEIKLSF